MGKSNFWNMDTAAVAEYAEDYTSAAFDPNIKCFKVSADSLRVTVNWGAIPKKGSSIAITHPTSLFTVFDGNGASIHLISVSYSISSVAIGNRVVSFQLNKAGLFTTFNNGPLGILIEGTGFKITIS